MRGLSSLAWRSLRARPLRSLLTVIGIGLGVAVLLAALSAGSAMDGAVGQAARDELGHASLRVSALRETGLTQASLALVRGTRGVAVAAPALERRTYLDVGAAGAGTAGPAGQLPPPVTVLGVDPALEARLHDMALREGVALSAGLEHSALVTQTLATQEGLRLGDPVSAQGAAASGPQSFRIVGIVAGDGTVPEADGRLLIVPLASAQTLFATTGLTRIDVGVASDSSVDQVTGGLEARLTVEPYLLSRQDDIATALRTSTADFRGTLLLVAAIVLFVGGFLIFNTLSMSVAERAREVGLLRAAGTTRRQVTELVLLQALGLGLAGTLLGVVGGLVLSALTTAWLRAAVAVPLSGQGLDAGPFLLSFVIGLGITLAASLEPAWRASHIPPVEALRRGIESGRGARLRWLLVVFVALGAIAAVAWPSGAAVSASGGAVGTAAASAGPLVVYGLLLVAVMALPIVLRPLLRLAGLPFLVFRNEERLARSALARDRSRTALTAGALVVGLAMVVALGTAADNVRHAGEAWLAETVPGSELLTSIRPIGPTEPDETDLTAVSGVASVSPIALFGVPYEGVRLDAAAVVGADLLADGRLTFDEGDRRTALGGLDAGGGIVLPRTVADRFGLHLGDSLAFATGAQPARLKVSGIVAHSIPGATGESVLLGWPDATKAAFGVVGADLFAVRYQAGREASARPALEAMARGYALEPSGLDAVGGTIGDALQRIFRLLDALALAAVLVAGLGIVNTLSMSVLERVREIGVLRATGMTSRQIWAMVVVEAGVLGLAGAIIGCAIGLVVGLLLVQWSSGGFGTGFQMPWGSIGLAACFGVLVSIVASIYPARLASRLSIVRALQYE